MLKRDKNKNKFVAADLIFIFLSSSRLFLPIRVNRKEKARLTGVTASVVTVSLLFVQPTKS